MTTLVGKAKSGVPSKIPAEEETTAWIVAVSLGRIALAGCGPATEVSSASWSLGVVTANGAGLDGIGAASAADIDTITGAVSHRVPLARKL